MADQNNVENNMQNNMQNTVRQLLTRLDELSSGLSSQRNDRVENEVRQVFNRQQMPVSSNYFADAGQLSGSSQPTSSSRATARTPLQQSNVPRLAVRNDYRNFVTRRNFSGQRPRSTQSSRRQRKPSVIDNRPFLRDLVLLGGPDTVCVPRQGARLTLMENGHVISGCRFTKGMTAAQVEIAVIEALDGKIPERGRHRNFNVHAYIPGSIVLSSWPSRH
jgi:hypothetical protein